MSRPQVGELLNRVAWEHRAEGWGLLKKPGGNRCPSPQGFDISCDILVHAPTVTHFDVLIDAGGASTPWWNPVGPCTSPPSGCEMSRFLAPVRPANLKSTGGVFDGDNKADLAIFRPSDGNWWIKLLSTGGIFSTQWGASG